MLHVVSSVSSEMVRVSLVSQMIVILRAKAMQDFASILLGCTNQIWLKPAVLFQWLAACLLVLAEPGLEGSLPLCPSAKTGIYIWAAIQLEKGRIHTCSAVGAAWCFG